jgi:hypothetical protein
LTQELQAEGFSDCFAVTLTSFPYGPGKEALVDSLLAAKESSGKTFTEIAKEVGLTNMYAAQLFYAQVWWLPH